MTGSFNHFLDQPFHGQSVNEILNLSPAALNGVTTADAQRLEEAFGIETIRDLAENRFFHRSLALLAGAGTPAYDPGPPPEWEAFFADAPLNHYQQHPADRFRLDFGPVYYRGRLDGSARVIVVGQDPATNELLAHRIFIGLSGQRVQGLLKKLGLTRSYAMLNTFLYSVFGQFNTELRNISLEAPILTYRNAFLDRLVQENPVQAIIAIGNGAQHAVQNWPGGGAIPVFSIVHPAAPDEAALLASWNAALPGLLGAVAPDDGEAPDPTPYGDSFQPADEASIPRYDLPFGLPDWHGVGSHGDRDGNKKIIWLAP